MHCRISEGGPGHDPDPFQASSIEGDTPVAEILQHVSSLPLKILKTFNIASSNSDTLMLCVKKDDLYAFVLSCSCVGSIMFNDRVMTREDIFPNLEMC